MKSELIINAEKAAREACAGLGYTLQQTQDFIDMHIEGELRRDEEKAKELASAKRNKALNNALVEITRSQTQRILCSHVLDDYALRYDPHNPDEILRDESPIISRGFDAEDQRDADTYQRQRNRGET